MAIFSSFASLFSGQPSSSKSPADEPTLAQAAHNRTKSKGKMALVRQDSDVYTSARLPCSSLCRAALRLGTDAPDRPPLQRVARTTSRSQTTSRRA